MNPSDVMASICRSAFMSYNSYKLIVSSIFSKPVLSIKLLIMLDVFLSLPRCLSGFTNKLLFRSLFLCLGFFLSSNLLVILRSLLYFGLEANCVLILSLLVFYFTTIIERCLKGLTAEFVHIEDPWVSHTSQDLSFSSFSTTNVRFFLPVEPHELDAKVRWKLI